MTRVLHLRRGARWADNERGVNDEGWYVQLDDHAHVGPFAARDAAEAAARLIEAGDVDDLPLLELWPHEH